MSRCDQILVLVLDDLRQKIGYGALPVRLVAEEVLERTGAAASKIFLFILLYTVNYYIQESTVIAFFRVSLF